MPFIQLVVKDIEKGIILLILAHVKDIFSKHIKVPFLGSQLIRFEIENLRRTLEKSVVFCGHNSVLVKILTKIFENKFGQVISYKLYN